MDIRTDLGQDMEKQMDGDYIVRATAAEDALRIFAVTSKNLVEEARRIHKTSPVVTAALGRLLTAGTMMGAMMKGEKDLLTLQVECDGPVGGMIVTADSKARVKGYARQPAVLIPANEHGKLDVAGAVGSGFLNVIRDVGMKEPYNGQTELISGEIAEDLTYYYAKSEQVPSSVGLGVLLNKENYVEQAGGFILQIMPFAPEEVISKVEESLKELHSVTELFGQGMTPEDLVRHLLGDLEVNFLDTIPARYYCNCSRERVSRAVAGVGRKDLEEMICEGRTIEVNCEFCDSHYYFTTEDLKSFL